jgi:hypothetical protein
MENLSFLRLALVITPGLLLQVFRQLAHGPPWVYPFASAKTGSSTFCNYHSPGAPRHCLPLES